MHRVTGYTQCKNVDVTTVTGLTKARRIAQLQAFMRKGLLCGYNPA